MSNMQQVRGRRKNTAAYIDTTFGLFRTVLAVLSRKVLKLDCYDVGNSVQYGLTLSGVRSMRLSVCRICNKFGVAGKIQLGT